MSAGYVRSAYGVDYKVGERLVMDGRHGVLVSFPNQYLGIRFDGDTHVSRAHPTWRISREQSPATHTDHHADDFASENGGDGA